MSYKEIKDNTIEKNTQVVDTIPAPYRPGNFLGNLLLQSQIKVKLKSLNTKWT